MGEASGRPRGVVVGSGDDAAVLEPSGDLIVATCDALWEGIHFELEQIGPRRLGAKAAHVNLSDIAAMGAHPRWALAALTVPSDLDVGILEEVYAGLRGELEAAGAALVGGNTARSTGGLGLEIAMIGEVARGKALLRSGARRGDAVCVTGDLGGSAAGLAALSGQRSGALCEALDAVISRHLEPRARLAAGEILGRSGWVTSCIDVSDGLLGDMGHVCERGGVGAVIEAAALPISETTSAACKLLGMDPLAAALTGGEDYELAFTVSPKRVRRIFDDLEAGAGIAATRVGTVIEGGGVSVLGPDGAELEIPWAAFDHLGGGR